MSTPPRKIFISYRQQDYPDFVERIRDWFIMKYGRENVFMDFDSIPPMVKFADYIRNEVEQCDVMLAIIGPRWLELLRERSANFEEDYVRVEVSLALQLDKLIMPICIMDGNVPKAAELPAELRPMLDYNAAFLHSGRGFLDNIGNILEAVEQSLKKSEMQEAKKYVENSDAKWKLGDYDGVIADCNKAIHLYPEYAKAYHRRGRAYNGKGEYDSAIADYNEAIQLDPQYAFAYNSRGWIRSKIGDLEGALVDYNEAIRLKPDDASFYNDRGITCYLNNDLDRAIADFMEAIHLNPQLTNPYAGLGNSYYDKGQFSEALAYYRRYIEIAGGNVSSKIAKRIKELEQRLKE